MRLAKRSQFLEYLQDSMRATLWVAVILAAMVGAALAGPLEDANAALIRKDYAKALPLYRPLAANGDPSAQVNLGYMYDEGLGVPRDFGEAVSGIGARPTKATHWDRTISPICIATRWVCRRTMCRRTCGSISPRSDLAPKRALRGREGPRQCRRENDGRGDRRGAATGAALEESPNCHGTDCSGFFANTDRA